MTDNSVVTLGYLKSSQGLPPVTEADNGKMLMVRDGAWHMIEVVNAEEGEY